MMHVATSQGSQDPSPLNVFLIRTIVPNVICLDTLD